MLEPYPKDDGFAANWEAMGNGVPTLSALAKLCAEALVESPPGAETSTPRPYVE